jgi:hypothetical protein
MKITAGFCLAVAIMAAACTTTSSPDTQETAVPTQTQTAYNVPPEISAAQLQSITLALADYGPRYATFETTIDSELTATVERAINSCDPFKEQTSLGKYGWSKGYVREFGLPEDGELIDSVSVGSIVDVYSTPENAATKIRYDSKQIYEDQKAIGGCQGIGLERIEELGLPTIGDQSWSVRVHFAIAGVRGSTHLIMFRRDRIVATVSVTRFNSEDSSAEVLDLAKKVDERLLTVITAPLSIAEFAPTAAEL